VDGNPSWDKAKTTMHKGKEVIEVPIKMKVRNLFAQSNNTFDHKSGDYRLLLFKIEEGIFNPFIFKAEQEAEEFKNNWKDLKQLSLMNIPDTFNGQFSFFLLDGKFVGSWKIKNGERTRALSYYKALDPKSDLTNSRISNYTYNCVVTTYTTYTQAGSGQPYITEQYEVWDCIFTPMFAGTGPDDSGGGGSEGPGCYEPHPDFEGLMVPCGSLDPECPCCHLPESQRADCEADEPPCEDLVLKTMEIASPGASGKNGGRYGMTRSNGTKPHYGLDIAAEPGTYVYSPFSGKVSRIVSSFSPGQYAKDSYGNYVTVESTDANGNIFYLRYCHLNYNLVELGDEIEVGQVIGIAGNTGNAKNVTNKHVHIYGAKKDSNGNIIRTNPEDYLKTKWDSSGNISVDPCTN
jgi:murein DD-endopeptidase MepM/ murein hydrolase activator NlpD